MTTNKSHSERKLARQTSGWLAGPPIPGHYVRHSDILRQLEIDSTVVQFTFQEYQLLMLLLVRSEGSYATFAQLAEAIYNNPLDDETIRKNLSRRLSFVRSKLWPFNIHVVCVKGFGYTYITQPDLLEAR
jgi:hypothetical protein